MKTNDNALQNAGTVCAICGDPIEGDFALAHALDGSLVPVCADCLEYDVTTIPRHGEKLIKCASCGELFVADPNAPDPEIGRQVFDEETLHWVRDDNSKEPFDDEQGAWRPDVHAWVCKKCLTHHHIRCSKCGCWTHTDDVCYDDDGDKPICPDCAEN